jgi:WD40 repeat protein
MTGAEDNFIFVWNYQKKSKLRELYGHTDFVLALEKIDDIFFCSSGSDTIIRIWNTNIW